MPKFLGILVFDQANEGAQEAHAELGNPGELLFVGPTPENSVAGQIEIMTTAATQGQGAVMLSNNAGDQIAPSAEAAQEAGTKVVTWDSPIPSGEGEDVFVAQVDFGSIGVVMADMAHSILGGEGQMAVLSATPDAANQNAWIAAHEGGAEGCRNTPISNWSMSSTATIRRKSATTARWRWWTSTRISGVIMSPTTVGIQAAAKAMQDEGLCDKVKVSGLGLPSEMVSYTMNGCAPEFALWDFRDLGYLTYYTAYGLATGQLTGEIGESLHRGPHGGLHDRGRSGPSRLQAHPDGAVHGLQQRRTSKPLRSNGATTGRGGRLPRPPRQLSGATHVTSCPGTCRHLEVIRNDPSAVSTCRFRFMPVRSTPSSARTVPASRP